MRLAVVINPGADRASGNRALASEIRELFARHELPARVVQIHEAAILEPEMRTLTALVGAGGDGTISSVAHLALGHRLPLGILPLGTRNHFARDLGLPDSLAGNVEVIARGKTMHVDVGEVNGRLFLNNASIGAYPRAVEHREALRRKYPLRKMAAMAVAVVQVFYRSRLLHAEIRLDGRPVHVFSPFVFVGNNRYDLNMVAPRFRSSLQGGQLCIFTAECHGLGDFLRLLWLCVRGRIERSDDLHKYCAENASVMLARSEVRVSTDGEVWHARTPLQFGIRKQALEVFVP